MGVKSLSPSNQMDFHNFTLEKYFIQRIGTGMFSKETIVSHDRKALLFNYIKALHKRTDWGLLDKHEVLAFAHKFYAGL